MAMSINPVDREIDLVLDRSMARAMAERYSEEYPKIARELWAAYEGLTEALAAFDRERAER